MGDDQAGPPDPDAREAGPVPAQRVALINMPWASSHMPSIQCGLLKAELAQLGHSVDVHYPNLELAAHIGGRRYEQFVDFAGMRTLLLGEWLFGTAAFGRTDDDDDYLDTLADECPDFLNSMILPGSIKARDALLELRNDVLPRWIERIATSVQWQDYDVIGFSSTFEQNVASLALARQIKTKVPASVLVFGGANVDGEMGPEYLRAFSWIDYVVVGEGDISFPRLIADLATGGTGSDIPGVRGRAQAASGAATQSPRVQDLDTIPMPDYSDYFDSVSRLGHRQVRGRNPLTLVYESARGCWWGEKHHCTFCGLNHLGMQFRCRSAARVLADLSDLTAKHRILNIQMTDNILDMGHINSLMPALAELQWDLRLFYEVKANINRDQILRLRQAGVLSLQPGIESLSSHVLSLMRKGSNMLINLRLLKWSQYYGMDAHWGILMGFPGETEEDYKKQLDLVPLISHLRPPGGCENIWLERFSPYFSEDTFPINNVRPVTAYRYVYPPEDVDLRRVAYFFDYQAEDVAPESIRRELSKAVRKWQDLWKSEKRPVFDYERGSDWVRLRDSRTTSAREVEMTGWRADAYQFCGETARSVRAVQEYASGASRDEVPENSVREFLDACLAEDLMVAEDGHYFNIALPQRRWRRVDESTRISHG